MKTMIELLLRLQELECSLTHFESSRQFTTREKSSLLLSIDLVRNTIPDSVLKRYDELKESEAALMRSPEIFAMAVLVATYKELGSREQERLLTHFALTRETCGPKRKKRLLTLKKPARPCHRTGRNTGWF
jgi:hypothetical protein